MKKIILLIFILSLYSFNAAAYEYPSAFWGVNEKYETALLADDYNGTIKYGKEIINMFSDRQSTPETRQILGSRYKEVAWAYSLTGDYETSLHYFKMLYNLTEAYKDELNPEWNMLAENAINHYTSEIAMYTDGGSGVYYGAKNEHKNGILFGTNADGAVRGSGALSNESMILTYQELGQDMLAYNTGVFNTARKSGCAVEYALNCPKEGTDIKNIKSYESHLKKISNLLSNYSDVPVYLRFAAEFDVWNNPTDAESFKTAFRYVSQYFKSRNSNVAIVWSPNLASAYGTDRDDFYPGDEYVDWVGVSLYSKKYYQSNKNETAYNSLLFKSGKNSQPIVVLKDLIETYGNRKPIMISESGAGHYTYSNVNADMTDFALERLKEYYYYIPMVYPQVKLMAHFDNYVSGGTEDYRLSTNSELKKFYLSAVNGGRFIQDSTSGTTDLCYRKITDGTNVDGIFEVSSYAYAYNTSITGVTYYLDGQYAGMSNEIPFSTYINTQGYSAGTHTLKAVAAAKNGKTITTEAKINISGMTKNVQVVIDGETISFEQEPIIYNDRTMVPMRKIFEELGAEVSWDRTTKTATGKKGERTVKITIGSNKMYVNNTVYELDTTVMLMGGSTLVPVRAIAEGMGAEVEWNGNNYTVYIEPKVFKWSEWDDDLPSKVNEDLYYIEEKTEYRYADKEYFELTTKFEVAGNYVREEIEYGNWSGWSTSYVSENANREVETRTQSSPKSYHYVHYCTGNLSNEDKRYKTSSQWFCDECEYHDLGWFSSPLSAAEDGVGYIKYKDDGNKYRCSNSCYRWYLKETSGGDYTEYRYRDIERKYIYYDWSDWSDWDEDRPRSSSDRKIESRTLYRYKEK